MGLFNFFKPKKDLLSDIIKANPKIRNFKAGAELDRIQAQVANLKSVGRVDDAEEVANMFLQKYISNSQPPFASPKELAVISYKQAYQYLPDLVYKRWDEFLDLWYGVIPFPFYLAIKGASERGRDLNMDQIKSYKFYEGDFDADSIYYLVEFPKPPITSDQISLEKFSELMKKGRKPSIDEMPILGPYLFAAIVSLASTSPSVYVLGQSGPEGVETTVRYVNADGAHGKCDFVAGPNPDPNEFLAWLSKKHLK